MGNQFTGTGNLGTAPTLRRAGPDQRPVAELRVYFDRRVPKGGGQFQDEGGFWLTVSVWGARAEATARMLQKGARVHVAGSLRQETWKDKNTGQERSELRLAADSVAIDPACVETVSYRPKKGQAGGPGGEEGEPPAF